MFGLFAKWRLPTNPSWRGLRRTSDKLETVTSRSQWHTRIRNHSSTLPRKLCEGDVMRFAHFPQIDHFAKSLRVDAEAQHLSSPRQFLDVPWGFVQWAEIQRSDCRWERVKIIDDIWLIRSLGPFWAMLLFNDCIKLSSNGFVRIGAKSQYRFSFETLGSHILCAARRVTSQSYSESMRLVPPIRKLQTDRESLKMLSSL